MSVWTRLFGRKVPKKGSASEADLPALPRPEGTNDAAELAAYITVQLERSVLKGWRVETLRGRLSWAIKKECPGPGEWDWQEYDLWVTKDLEVIILTHDNCDIGLGPVFLNAVVLNVRDVMHNDRHLTGAVRHVMARFKPNEWGYT
jgi:hypothetical protein